MTSFWDAFNAEANAARSTVEGAAFVAAGYTVQMTGGGCMAWEAKSADGRAFVWITDEEGFSIVLGGPETADHYIVGLYLNDMDEGTIIDCGRDPAEAIAKAAEALAEYGGVNPTDRRAVLSAEYVRVVGYDPFVDFPAIDVEEVAGVIAGMPAVIESEAEAAEAEAAEEPAANLLDAMKERGLR